MNFLDLKTVIFSHVITDAVCAVFMGVLWYRNRRRFAGLSFWVADYVMQAAAVVIILLRGTIPDAVSSVLGGAMAVGGAWAMLMGLERFTGKPGARIHNYGFMSAFVLVHAWFSLVQPHLAARTVNFSAGIIFFTFQCMWLLLFRVDEEMRTIARGPAMVFGTYCAVSILRVVFIVAGPYPERDFFRSGTFETLLILAYQMLFIIQTYSLALMVNRRLLGDIQTQEERFRTMADFTYDWEYWVGPDKRIIYTTPSCESITGYGPREFIEDEGLKRRIVHPDDRTAVGEHLDEGFSASEPGSLDFRIVTRNGEIRWINHVCRPVYDSKGHFFGRRVSNRDITRRRTAEDLMRMRLSLFEFAESHSLDELLQKTLDEVGFMTHSPIGFYHFLESDQKTLSLHAWSTRTVQEFCRAQGKGLHYPIEEAGVWVDCVHQRRPVIHNDYASLPHRKGMPPGHAEVIREMVVPIMRKEKIVAILGIGNKPVEYTEKDVEIVSYLADIAYVIIERKRAEEEIRMLNAGLEKRVEERTAELREAHEKLLRQERLAVLGQLAGGVGHELRNPLAVMTNAVYFLRLIQPDADEKVKEYHRILENEIKNAEKIIRDLLDYARVPSTDRRPVKPYDLAAAAIERFPAPENIAVNMDIPLDLPFVRVDQRQIIQVLGNIFENAYQAMPGGGTMTVSAREKGDEVVIRVTDTGPGIASENLGRIFEPLFTTKTRGIGLGLAVSRKLTKANDGRLEAESEPGKGSTFALVLPLEKKEGRL